MSTKTTFNLLFYINASRKTVKGEVPLYLRITMNGNFVTMSLKRWIKPELWDGKMGKCKGSTFEAKEINRFIDSYKTLIHNKYVDLMQTFPDITAELLKDHLLGLNTAKSRMLCEIWEEQIADLKALVGKQYSKAIYQKHNTAIGHMREFLKLEYKTEDISIKRVNFQLINKFQIYLRVHRNCNHNSSIKYLQNFKRVISLSIKNGWIKTNPFSDVKLTLEDVDPPYLTENEIQRIINLQLPMKRLDMVRDLFVFSCFCGLAYSDIEKLNRGEIVLDSDGVSWIKMRRQKTKIRSQIPLLEIPKQIIKKYTDLEKLSIDDKVFKVYSNQKLNAYLKEIQNLANIEKNLTFHVARHTFATTVTMMHDVPIESVSKMLGHTNIRTTQHYARIVDKKVSNDMSLLAEKLSGRFVYNSGSVYC